MQKTYRVRPGLKGHQVGPRLYKPGETLKLEESAVIGLEDRLELVEKGEKDEKDEPVVNSAPVPTAPVGPATVMPDRTPDRQEAEKEADWRTLPKDLVNSLVGGGFNTPARVREATDDQLLGINGVGAAKVKVIREILA